MDIYNCTNAQVEKHNNAGIFEEKLDMILAIYFLKTNKWNTIETMTTTPLINNHNNEHSNKYNNEHRNKHNNEH